MAAWQAWEPEAARLKCPPSRPFTISFEATNLGDIDAPILNLGEAELPIDRTGIFFAAVARRGF